ncbi:MAG: hypothetical protein IKU08_06545 [Clostridia bacterium]|nr:hypothetical protein [Clostridia bacterium]
MKKSVSNFENAYIPVSDKKVMSFDPPAYGILKRNILTGDFLIAENSRCVPVTEEQAENIIEINF